MILERDDKPAKRWENPWRRLGAVLWNSKMFSVSGVLGGDRCERWEKCQRWRAFLAGGISLDLIPEAGCSRLPGHSAWSAGKDKINIFVGKIKLWLAVPVPLSLMEFLKEDEDWRFPWPLTCGSSALSICAVITVHYRNRTGLCTCPGEWRFAGLTNRPWFVMSKLRVANFHPGLVEMTYWWFPGPPGVGQWWAVRHVGTDQARVSLSRFL